MAVVACIGDETHSAKLQVLSLDGDYHWSIDLPGRPRWCVTDTAGRRVSIPAIREPSMVLTAGLPKLDAVLHWEVLAQLERTGSDINKQKNILYVACDGGSLVEMDALTGRVLNEWPVSGVPDATFFNPSSGLVHVAIGDPGLVQTIDPAHRGGYGNQDRARSQDDRSRRARTSVRVFAFASRRACSRGGLDLGEVMHRLTIVLAIIAGFMGLSFTSAIVAQPVMPEPVAAQRKIILGNVSGRIDHMAVDLAHHRLFVAELGNDTVGVVDLDAQKVVNRLSGLKEPQGVVYVQANDLLYVANGGDGSVRVFRGAEYAPAVRIDLGADADNIRVDLPDNRLLVGYGSGGIGTVDLRSNDKIRSFPLKAHPESFQLDAGTNQIFVNPPNNRAIAVLDATTGWQRAAWSLAHGGNFPMALDAEHLRVVVFSLPKFAAFSWQTGDVVSEIDTCGDADDLFLDAKRKLIYITCGTGFIDVLKVDDLRYSRVMRIATVAGARTGLFVPDMERLFLAVRAQAGES